MAPSEQSTADSLSTVIRESRFDMGQNRGEFMLIIHRYDNPMLVFEAGSSFYQFH